VERALSTGIAALAAVLIATPVRADPPPRIYDMVWSPDAHDVVLVTNRGLIFADTETHRFRLMCNQALDVGVGDPPDVAYLPDRRLIAATTPGLRVSSDGGCTWRGVDPLATIQTPALAQHPSDLNSLYVASYGPGASGIHVTHDGGAIWASALALGDDEFTHSLSIAAANPQRIYAAGMKFDATSRSHYLVRSSDGGRSWERTTIPLAAGEERASVIAINPANADELLVKTTALDPDATPERLLVSRDRGDHFAQVFVDNQIVHASYGEAAANVWVSDAQGLWRSTDGMQNFARQGPARWMTFAQEREGRLWGCGQFAGLGGAAEGVGLALRIDDPFSSWMDFRDVKEPVACGAGAPSAVACDFAWAHWQVEVLGYSDGGVPDSGGAGSGSDAGVEAGAGAAGAPQQLAAADDGGCAVFAGSPRPALRGLALLLLAVLAARQRTLRR